MDTNTNIKTSTLISTAFASGVAVSSFYYFYGNGKNLRNLADYIKEVNHTYGSEVKTFSPYNLLKTGEIQKALSTVHELEPEVSSEFYRAIKHYRNMEKSPYRTGLADVIAKGLKKTAGEIKGKLKSNFSEVFKEYMRFLSNAQSFQNSDILEISSNLKKTATTKTSIYGLLTSWIVYQVLRHIKRGGNDNQH